MPRVWEVASGYPQDDGPPVVFCDFERARLEPHNGNF
jgi:hypothetical protein